MSKISDEHLISALARASREFERVRGVLLREDEPTPERVAGMSTGGTRRTRRVPGAPTGEHTGRGGVLGAAGSAAQAAASAAGTVGSAAAWAARFGVRRVTGQVHPRHEDWSGLSTDERIQWWVDRFGTGVAALVALPSFGGIVTRTAMSPILNTVGAAGQVLVVNAVAHEVGGTDEADRVVAAASIVLGRDLDLDAVRRQLSAERTDEGLGEPDELQAELDQDQDDPPGVLRRLGSTALLIRRVARQFRSLAGLQGERPQGGLVARAMRNLPVVGMLGGFLAERGGVRQAAQAAQETFRST
ncbi:hypothetical protein [Ornithinimicrobium pratense]|uniref:Uncharacterized protein n=1 Tax=Ornithinimicrobium pratense TaxID=2593973 RepID=A0A5J6V213_9MICO|nr:hypothetical protein [Ornithinimicrobium pratense]QFG67910.1 hypothetical protein FY030_03500 [Ornithinimicrobium pratense]